jgi:ribosomal protein S18 acetylase RimI-like enzyme
MYIVFPAPVNTSATIIKDKNKMGLKQIDHGTNEYKQMIALRQSILREPLGLSFTNEELEKEKDNILIAAYEDDDMLGCCMLTKIDRHTLQLRQMAVKNNLQGKGIGASIINFAETISRDKGYRRIIMHARDTAIGFYEKFGYKVKGDPFTEINLPHHIMEKGL